MFFRKPASKGGAQWLVVCLGNPGDKYEGTRHNVGFAVADELAERHKVPLQRLKFRALTHLIREGETPALLMKPVTFMNLSGESAREAAAFYKIPPERVLVVLDEVALPPGKLRIRKGGSAGGHNGVKNLIAHLGTDQFPRIRIGVGGKPHPDYDMADWVLSRPVGEDAKEVNASILRAADAVTCCLSQGLDKAMAQFNR